MGFHYFLQAVFFLTGFICLLATLLNWDWLFNSRNAHSLSKIVHALSNLFRRKKAKKLFMPASRLALRIIYGVLGIGLMLLSGYLFHLTRIAFAASN